MTTQQRYNTLLAEHLIGAFAKRNIGASYCPTKHDALEKILSLIPPESTSACGGSETLRELGVRAALKARGDDFLDPDDEQGATAKEAQAHKALCVDYYLMGCNAIAETGELVNIDGIGNRTAALIFGPKHVILAAGLNKVEPSVDAALHRARTLAARQTLLLHKPDFSSFEQLSQAAAFAGNQAVITSGSIYDERIHVVLIGEVCGC